MRFTFTWFELFFMPVVKVVDFDIDDFKEIIVFSRMQILVKLMPSLKTE